MPPIHRFTDSCSLLALLFRASPRVASRLACSALGASWLSCVICIAAELPNLPPSGIYDRPLEVDHASRIDRYLYTTDGSTPTATHGTELSGPLAIRQTTVLKLLKVSTTAEHPAVITRTYVIPATMAEHQGQQEPLTWGERDGWTVPADYDVDPEVVNSTLYRERFLAAWQTLPTLSLSMQPADLWDPSRGIYANPLERGEAWERPATLEFLPPQARPQPGDKASGWPGPIDCGVRIQGGWNRRPEECPKHSFRLVFQKPYGGRLKAHLFADSSPSLGDDDEDEDEEDAEEEFDTLILRSGCNNTWLHWSAVERQRGDYLRDQWLRDTYAALGQPSARGRFVHLLLNGRYWGLYNLTERPSAGFVAKRLGGKKKDYDVRNGDNMVDGDEQAWKELWLLVDQQPQSADWYQAMTEQLDIAPFIDYMLVNLYGANGDYDGASNWYAARHRRQGPQHRQGRWRFFIWDGERTLEDAERDVIEYDADQSPARIFQRLRTSPQFRSAFAQRAREVLQETGPLGARLAGERYQKLAQQLAPAIVAESARWGDYRRDVHSYREGPYLLYTVDEHWQVEIDRLLSDFFPHRTAIFRRQLAQHGLIDPESP